MSAQLLCRLLAQWWQSILIPVTCLQLAESMYLWVYRGLNKIIIIMIASDAVKWVKCYAAWWQRVTKNRANTGAVNGHYERKSFKCQERDGVEHIANYWADYQYQSINQSINEGTGWYARPRHVQWWVVNEYLGIVSYSTKTPSFSVTRVDREYHWQWRADGDGRWSVIKSLVTWR